MVRIKHANTTTYSLQVTPYTQQYAHPFWINNVMCLIIQYDSHYYIVCIWHWNLICDAFELSLSSHWRPNKLLCGDFLINDMPFILEPSIFQLYAEQYTSQPYTSLTEAKKDCIKLSLLSHII